MATPEWIALREAAQAVSELGRLPQESAAAHFERIDLLFYQDTGTHRPGVDVVQDTMDYDTRIRMFNEWIAGRYDDLRAALAPQDEA
jgi:hypothetical protein